MSLVELSDVKMNITTQIQNTQHLEQINSYFNNLRRGVEMLVKKDFTSLYVVSKAGLGKSTVVDNSLRELNADFVVFKGDMSEARCFAFLQDY